MPEKVHRIHSLPADAPWQGGLPPEGSTEHPIPIRALDRVLRVQRPVVLAHLRSIRLRHPSATPEQLLRILERRYLAAVTGTGAAVGATAVVPGIGTVATLALSGAETLGFLEATALFAQSVAEVHGIRVSDPDRARALVMTMILGTEGTQLIQQLGSQFGGGATRSTFWGELVTKTLPRAALGPVTDRLKHVFLAQFAKRGGASFVGKALPFGVGAVIGAGGNNILGRRVVRSAKPAFGPPPLTFPEDLSPRLGAQKLEAQVASATAGAMRSAASAVGNASRSIGGFARDAAGRVVRRRPSDQTAIDD
ncbi:hypothetical protein [Microbacterium gorillae]|uniref:hypothetical protein n=1 Tax=Microbacterium gorillae TaxID=1231063 RepID=UPI000693A2A6|nr:hypothetical protein [Microbacterium gorillae]